MSAARPPEGGSHRSRQAEGSLMSAARAPEGGHIAAVLRRATR
jgi:hypothetical protein